MSDRKQAGGPGRPISPAPSIKKQFSFEAMASRFGKKTSDLVLSVPTSPKSSAKSPVSRPPEQPPSSLNRQQLKDFLLAREENPSLEGVVRLGNLCFQEIEGHGLHPRAPEMCQYSALLLEYANQRKAQLLTPVEQRNLGFSHYHAWCTGGIVAEVSNWFSGVYVCMCVLCSKNVVLRAYLWCLCVPTASYILPCPLPY